MAYFVLFTASGEQWILLLNSPAKLGMVGKMAVFLSVKHELGNSIRCSSEAEIMHEACLLLFLHRYNLDQAILLK